MPGLVEAVLTIAPADDEAGVLEGPELQRHRAKRDVGHGRGDVAGRHLALPDQPEDFPAAGRGDGGEVCMLHSI